MTLTEFEIAISPACRLAIEQNIGRNPVDIALDKHIENAQIVATQVKRLQRAKSKLPSYYAVRAVLPPRAYEQSSSEAVADCKRMSGNSALDLTAGLGVDVLALSRRFDRVVCCERDEVLSQITRYNLNLLGVKNVEVLNISAEEYLEQCSDHFDWIFVDPDRRTESGDRVVLLEDCSPNVVALMERMRGVADNICIKCSPLFDMAEALRLFEGCSVSTLSLGGECKQVNIYIDHTAPTIRAEAVGVASFEIGQSEAYSAPFAAPTTDFERYKYLILPDVSLVHSRLVAAAFAGRADVWSNNGVALATERPQGVVGRVFEIERVCRFGDKELKKLLKGSRTELFLRDFAMGSAALYRKFSMREGADARWCFTRIDQALLAFKLI